MRIGFTGTREGMTAAQEDTFGQHFRRLGGTQFHHGACIGADADAVLVVKEMAIPGMEIIAYPGSRPSMTSPMAMHASDVRHMPREMLARNRDIVDASEVLMACPKGEENISSGTWYTIRYARRLKRKVLICWPDGNVTEEN